MNRPEDNGQGEPGYGPMPPYGDPNPGADPYGAAPYGAAPYGANSGLDGYPGGMPPHPWGPYGGQGYYGVPPHAYHPGYGAPHDTPWGGVPEGVPGGPGQAPQSHAAKGSGAGAGSTAAPGEMADKSGLGMFKELFELDDGEFWKGAIVGAAALLLMTNENLRNSLIGGAARTADAMKAGFAGFAEPQQSDDEIDESVQQQESEDE